MHIRGFQINDCIVQSRLSFVNLKCQGIHINYYTWDQNVWHELPWGKMPMFQKLGIRKGGLPLPPGFQYLILMIWWAYDLNLVMISLYWLRNAKTLNLEVFHFIKWLKNGHPNFRGFAILKPVKISWQNLNHKL